MFHQPPYVNPPSLPAAAPPPPPPAGPALDLAHVPPMQRDAAVEYDHFLAQLTFNSKDVITSLTRIAGENMNNAADAISTVIEQRSFHAAPHAKLPFLYLIDSIIKNIGGKYIPCFGANLYHTFTSAYAVAPQAVRMSMHRLLNTWPQIFGMEVVTAMRRNAADHDAMPLSTPQQPQALPVPRQQSHALRMPPQQAPPYSYPNPAMRQPALAQPAMQQPALQQPPLQQPPMPQPALRQPPPRLSPQPMPPQQMPAQISRPIPQSQMPQQPPHGLLRSQPPGMPTPVAAQMQRPLAQGQPLTQPPPMAQPPPPPEFVEAQEMMQAITRKAAMGIHPSSHQLFTMNKLITQQLRSSPPPFQRDTLLRFQQQLRDISAVPRQSPPPQAYTSSAAPVADQVPPSVPPAVSAGLSELLRSCPPDLLSRAHLPQPQPPIHARTSISPPTSGMLRSGTPITRPAAQTVPVFNSPLPPALKFADLRTISHAAAVRSLYTELPHLSKSDGMRFATTEQLRIHLDWLFHQNRRKRGGAPNVVVGGSSRGWYEQLDVFLGKDSGSDTSGVGKESSPLPVNANESDSKRLSDEQASGRADQKDRNAAVTEARGENELCAACNEGFETFWDDDRQAWMLRGAERTEDGEVFHTRCVEILEADEKRKADEAETNTTADVVHETIPHGAQVKAETTALPVAAKVNIKAETLPTSGLPHEPGTAPQTAVVKSTESKAETAPSSHGPVAIKGEAVSASDDSRPNIKAEVQPVAVAPSAQTGTTDISKEDRDKPMISPSILQKRKREETEDREIGETSLKTEPVSEAEAHDTPEAQTEQRSELGAGKPANEQAQPPEKKAKVEIGAAESTKPAVALGQS